MTPSEFLEKLSQLPPDTVMTAEHMQVMLEAVLRANNLQPDIKKASKADAITNYSQLDDEQMISKETLANWLAESPRTIEKWRDGDGPPMLKKGKNVRYRVGDVKNWIKQNTYNSIGERQQAEQDEFMKKLNSKGIRKLTYAGREWDSFTATIFVDDKPMPFFETFEPEMNVTGYEVKWNEAGSLAAQFLEQLSQNPKSAIKSLQDGGADLNQSSHFLVGKTVQSRTLAHTVATLAVTDTDQYQSLILEMLDSGIDFAAPDEEGRNAMQLAQEHGNELLVKILSSYSLHWQLQAELPINGTAQFVKA